jgi:hypothetical protein
MIYAPGKNLGDNQDILAMPTLGLEVEQKELNRQLSLAQVVCPGIETRE